MSNERFNELLGCLLSGPISVEDTEELVRLAKGDPSSEQEIQSQLEAVKQLEKTSAELIRLANVNPSSEQEFESRLEAVKRLEKKSVKVRQRLDLIRHQLRSCVETRIASQA